MKKILYNLWDIMPFFVSILFKIIIYGKQISPDYFSYSHLLYPAAASLLISISVLILLKHTIRFKGLIVLDLMISILLICDINYFRYFKDIPSLSVVRNGILLGPVKSSVLSLFKFTDLLFLCDIIIFLIVFRVIQITNKEFLNFKVRLSLFAVILAIGGLMNYNYFYKLSIEQPKLLSTMFNRVYIAKELGIINAHAVDVYNEIKNSLERNSYISDQQVTAIKEVLGSNLDQESVLLKGEGKGKNLIMIQVEALQQFVINKSVDGKEITPNLNKWIKKSAYFDNFFYQVSAGGTSDAEFMANNSLYPAPSGAAYYLYYKNKYSSLATLLKSSGYNTSAFHGFKGTFWNRDVMYVSEGFNNFYSERDFNIDRTVGLGLSDESFLNQSFEKIKSMNKPFYSFLITLSSHFPFDGKEGYGEFSLPSYENTLMGDYLRSIHYTDEALGKFLDNLEKEKLLEDSIVVIYGDHSAIPKDKQEELTKFLNLSNINDCQWAMLQKVPMLVHFPEDAHKGVYKTFGGQVDILPTLANIFSLDNSNTLGKDLFNTKDNTVIFRSGSFTDGTVYYSSQENLYYNISDNKITEENEELKSKKENSAKHLEYSDEILKHDLLKK